MNELLTIEMVTYEALRLLTNQLRFSRLVNRNYDKYYAVSGAKIGDTVSVRKPPKYVGRKGNALVPEASVETKTNVKLTELAGVDLAFTSIERTLSLDNYSDRILKPVIAKIGQQIDEDGLYFSYPTVYNCVGTPGVVPATRSVYLGAGVKLDNEAAPVDDNRALIVNSEMEMTILDAGLVYYNPSQTISEQYRSARLGANTLGFNWAMSQNTPVHTIGDYAGTPLVDGSGQTGANLVTKGWTAAKSLAKGDVITVGVATATLGCFAVNPMSRKSTRQLRQFVVTDDCTADGAGAMTIPISPSLVGPGSAFQTVDILPVDGFAITPFGNANTVTPQGIAFHRDAFVLVTADLETVKGVHECARASDDESGLSIRIITAYDIQSNQMFTRAETLYGWATPRPELACRIAS